MNPFERVEIGDTGVSVTTLGLGGAPLSGMVLADGIFGGTPYAEALRIVRRAYDLGIRYFDTAPLYGEGRSEVRYGRVLSGLPRDSFSLSTKVSRVLEPADPEDLAPRGDEGLPRLEVVFDFSRDGILRSLDESLARLNLDAVDIVYLHDSDYAGQHPESDFAGALPTLIELREKGAVRAIGMGMNEWRMTARMVRSFELDIVLLAGRYTLLDQQALEEFLPLCVERGVRIAIGGPYNSGILARDLSRPVSFDYQRAPEELVERARALRRVCDRHEVDLKAAALQFVLAHPAVATVVSGAQSVAELEENVQMVQASIPEELWTELKAEGLIPDEAPTP